MIDELERQIRQRIQLIKEEVHRGWGAAELSGSRSHLVLISSLCYLLRLAKNIPELKKEQRCSAGCPGWFEDAAGQGIVRCDECDRFYSDEEAAAFAEASTGRKVRMYFEDSVLPFDPSDLTEGPKAKRSKKR